jgi:formylglycine-generating enzyme required for sulfatase activity
MTLKTIFTGMVAMMLAFSGCSFWEEYVPTEDDGDSDSTSDTTYQPSRSMVLVIAKDKTFKMGSDQVNGAKSVHTVRFTYDFWMDTTEVTQKQYDLVMKAAYANYETGEWNQLHGKGDNYPAHSRTWYDAALYCNALSKIDKLDNVFQYDSVFGTPGNGSVLFNVNVHMDKTGYRMPTEAEWEYACRAGTTTEYYWGSADAKDYACFSASANSNSLSSCPVAQKRPNKFGLYDMSGNLKEWCIDWYGGEYPDSSAVNPVILTVLINVAGDPHRILRGGSFSDETEKIRSASRSYTLPSHFDQYIGFRTVRRKP